MGFDLATARPLEAAPSGGFDLSTAKAAAPTPKMLDGKVDHAARGAIQAAAEEPSPHLAQIGSVFMAPVEAVQEATGSLTRKEVQGRAQAKKELGIENPLSRVTNTGTEVALGTVAPAFKGASALGKIVAGGMTGAGYGAAQPTEGKGEYVIEKAKQAGGGFAGGAALNGIIQAIGKSPEAFRSILSTISERLSGTSKAAAPTRPGAEAVTGELQRQRDVAAGREQPKTQGGSEYERMSTDFDQRMKPVKDAALNDATPVDASPVVQQIKNLQAQSSAPARQALQEVLQEIRHFSKQALPPAGSTMTPAQLRSLQSQGDTMTVKGADEVRQFIKLKIEQTGEKALDDNTKRVLAEVQGNLSGRTPQVYRDYLDQYRKGAVELDKFKPDQSAMGRLTKDERGVKMASEDSQIAMENVFKGKTPQRDLQRLVEDIRHDPAATIGLQESFGKWLMPTNQVGKVDIDGAAKNWNNVKDSVKSSGMMTPQHFAAVDKVMTDLFKSEQGAAGLKGAGGAVAALVGTPFGRPGTFANAARTGIGFMTSSEKTPEQVGSMIQKAMSDPVVASELAQRLERSMNVTTGSETGKRPRVLGLNPMGL